MIYRVIQQCAQSLKNLETCFDKAEQGAAAKHFDVSILMTSRLAPDIVELSGMPSPVFLLEKAPGSVPFADATPRSYARHWTPVHLDFLVRDIDTAIARAVAAGASSEGPLHTYNWGKIAYFADPFGNGFCLLSYR